MSIFENIFNPETIKLNCSRLVDIIPSERGRIPFTKEHIKVLREIYIEAKYGRRKRINSPYIEKGKTVERESINLLGTYLGINLTKNEEKLENDYIKGIPDIILENEVIDVKSCWDIFTLPDPFFDDKTGKNNEYYWQMQGYLALTGKERGSIAYVLTNHPDFLIEQEVRKRCREENIDENDEEEKSRITSQVIIDHSYDDIPLGERVRIFYIERNEEDINKIYQRVVECRAKLKEILCLSN